MSRFDDLRSSLKGPGDDAVMDLEGYSMRGRPGRKDKGGASGGAEQAAQDAKAESQAPEPSPQRDDPDDGAHKESSPEPEAAPGLPAEQESAPAPEEDEERVGAGEAGAPGEGQGHGDDGPSEMSPELREAATRMRPVAARPGRPEGMAELTYDRSVAFSFEGDKTTVRSVPVDMVDELRDMLAPFGATLASEASAGCLITAFIVARAGLPNEGYDSNTTQAVEAFRMGDPALAAVEASVRSLGEAVMLITGAVGRVQKSVSESVDLMRSVEGAQAWLLADRVQSIGTNHSSVDTIDLEHPVVERARAKMGGSAQAVSCRERINRGRPIR